MTQEQEEESPMKLPADTRTRVYELTYLIPTSYSETERQAVDEAVQKTLKRYKAEVKETADWGKRDMAYKIRHGSQAHAQAYYSHVVFEVVSENVQAIEKDIYLQNEIMRHLLVVVEE